MESETRVGRDHKRPGVPPMVMDNVRLTVVRAQVFRRIRPSQW